MIRWFYVYVYRRDDRFLYRDDVDDGDRKRAKLRYVITGGSGYIGSHLADSLSAVKQTSAVVVADIAPPATLPDKAIFRQVDVRDMNAVADMLAEERPDALVHAAFIVDPTHDEPAMYEVNVNGTFNVLAAAASENVERIVSLSATMAYGAWANNPLPITESQPVHGHAHYVYARHATEADRIAQLWATLHRRRQMTIVRPCTVFGPGADNHLVRMWESQSFFPDFGTGDQPTQFLHIEDCVAALTGLIEGAHAGVFNLTPDDTISWHECARLAGLEVRGVREQSFTGLAEGMWRMKLPNVEIPPSFVDFFKYPYVAANDRLSETLPAWQPRHGSRETFEQMLADRVFR